MTQPYDLDILQDFTPVSLRQMEQVSLYNRVEVKYVMPVSLLPGLLVAMSAHYNILEIGGEREFGYTTNYFDLPDFRLYKDHHNDYVNRIKIRQRLYENSGECYFEVKHKVNDSRTQKTRKSIPALHDSLTDEEMSLVQYRNIAGKTPEFKLCNRFNRMTFSDPLFSERITIDTAISMTANNTTETIDGIALVEIKQYRIHRECAAVKLLRAARLHNSSFSKYAIGVSLLYPHIKHNNFKPTILNFKKYGAK